MYTANRCVLNLVILYFSFLAINTSTYIFIDTQNTVSSIPCTKYSDCVDFGTDNFTCSNQYCECNESKFDIHPNKSGLNRLEEPCSTDSDCMMEYSVCQKGKCGCETDKVASSDKRSCLINRPKENCTNCSQTENICLGGQCSCEKGFVPNYGSTQCLKIAMTIHDFCEEDVQCSETFVNAVCITTSCQCQASYRFNPTTQTWVKNAVLGGQCETDEDCEQSSVATSNIICLSGLCKCQFLEKGGQCTNIIEPCIETVCSGFSVKRQLSEICVPGRCECPEERQYCTNGFATEPIEPAKKKSFNPDRDHADNDVNENVQKLLSNWELRVQQGALVSIFALIISTFYVTANGVPEALQDYGVYVFCLNIYLISMGSLVVLGHYDIIGDITAYLVVPCVLLGTLYYIALAFNQYAMPYIINRFFPDDNFKDQQDETQVQPDESKSIVSEVDSEVHPESPNISTSSARSPPNSRGRGRARKKRRR